MKELSLVVPAYNEASALAELAGRTRRAFLASGMPPGSFELVLVDNGSTDETPAVLDALAGSGDFSFLRPLRIAPNRGYGHGMIAGLRAAEGRVLATSHADLQCDPADVFHAFAVYLSLEPKPGDGGAERPVLVKGSRHGRPLPARIVTRSMEVAALALLRRRLHEINAQPKVFPGALVPSLAEPPGDFRFDLYLLLRALETGHEVHEVDVLFPPRPHGESHWARSFRGRLGTFARFLAYMATYRAGGARFGSRGPSR